MSEEMMNESEELEEVVFEGDSEIESDDDDFDDDYTGDDDEDIPAADDEYEEVADDEDVTYSEGPAVFSRARENTGGAPAGRRRNIRSLAREVKMEDIDYKRVQILSRFVDRHGRILSRRKTRISAKMQRKVTREIKRARHLALMPYTGEHVRITRKRG